MIEYTEGDITKEPDGLIVHQVNCQGVQGSGVALAIKTKWPVVYDEYMKAPTGKQQLGEAQFVKIQDGLYVGNLWGQEHYGNDGKIYTDKMSLLKALHKAFSFAEDFGLEIKSPKIGSGLGGLDWDRDTVPLFELIMTLYPNVKVKVFTI